MSKLTGIWYLFICFCFINSVTLYSLQECSILFIVCMIYANKTLKWKYRQSCKLLAFLTAIWMECEWVMRSENNVKIMSVGIFTNILILSDLGGGAKTLKDFFNLNCNLISAKVEKYLWTYVCVYGFTIITKLVCIFPHLPSKSKDIWQKGGSR